MSTRRWAVWGALFGVCFPVMALGIRGVQLGWGGAWDAAVSDPLLWIIFTAPLFLGAFATLGGAQHDKVRAFSEELEQRVEERTAELNARNRAMRVVLDNVHQGLATIRSDGTLDSECSAAFRQWFDDEGADLHFSAVLAANDNDKREMLALGWEGLTDGFLPQEIAVDQIPSHIAKSGREYELSYKPLGGEVFDGALLVVDDVTERIAQRKRERDQQELVAVFQAVVSDRGGFINFFEETERLVAQLCEGIDSAVTEKRHLHTVKGNCSIFSVDSVASVCHRLESECAEASRTLHADDREALWNIWEKFSLRVRSLLGSREEEIVEVQYQELDRLVGAALAGQSGRRLAERILRLRHEPTRTRFLTMERQCHALAKKLGKPQPRVVIEDGGVRVQRNVWDAFWNSLIHVVRNAMDHGLEAEKERLAFGKPARGTLKFSSSIDQDQVIIAIEDDGRGIDWAKIASRAKTMGLPATSPDELCHVLFVDGVSTRDEVSETSGRGVGTAAALKECESLGGRVEVKSARGAGTSFKFRLPYGEAEETGCTPSLRAAVRPSLSPPAQRSLRPSKTAS